eukprot:m.165119 g.165119  ORF g.165119 m.165119 type:complete len:150 (+) comp14666_c0_seq5:445-894(+)
MDKLRDVLALVDGETTAPASLFVAVLFEQLCTSSTNYRSGWAELASWRVVARGPGLPCTPQDHSKQLAPFANWSWALELPASRHTLVNQNSAKPRHTIFSALIPPRAWLSSVRSNKMNFLVKHVGTCLNYASTPKGLTAENRMVSHRYP